MGTIVKHQGKTYRRVAPPMKGLGITIPGEWEQYREMPSGENWHAVRLLAIRDQLDRKLAKEGSAV